jgi:hypothetical protein
MKKTQLIKNATNMPNETNLESNSSILYSVSCEVTFLWEPLSEFSVFLFLGISMYHMKENGPGGEKLSHL